jgi:anti-anti-sigma factor
MRGPETLVVDLSGVSAVDVRGLAVLVYACRAASAAHVKLVLASPSPLVLGLLEPARLSELCKFDVDLARPLAPRGAAA